MSETEWEQKVSDAVRWIQERSDLTPRTGLVLGSGLGRFADTLDLEVTLPYPEIPHFPKSSVSGHAGHLVLARSQGVPCCVMQGRVHYYEGYNMQETTFPIRVLSKLGVERLIITNAAGGINKDYLPGDIMLIEDHLNLTGDNPLRGPNESSFGTRFPDMSQAYSKELLKELEDVAEKSGLRCHRGVYAGLGGPSYETPAEIRMLEVLGADAVGMSTVAEVIVAVHCGLKVQGISVISNLGSGISTEPLSHDEVKETADSVFPKLCKLLGGLLVAH